MRPSLAIYHFNRTNKHSTKELLEMLNENFIDKKELKAKIKELQAKSKDFDCCLEVLKELEEALE